MHCPSSLALAAARALATCAIAAWAPVSSIAQATTPTTPATVTTTTTVTTTSPAKPAPSDRATSNTTEDAPVVTTHTLGAAGGLAYTASAGYLPIKAEADDPLSPKVEAKIFHIFYTAKSGLPGGDPARPIIFLFNGGPGSSSVWLHMGAFGPRRVKLNEDGTLPPPPFELVDNESCPLPDADLCFVDPVGTGFSRSTKADNNKKAWGVKQDQASLGEFIRLFLARNERFRSPIYLAGESYGTFRSAGLSRYLLDKNIALSGIVLISTVLDMRTIWAPRGHDRQFAYTLPVFAAAAWHHKKLPADLQALPLAEVRRRAEEFADTTYTVALGRGGLLAMPPPPGETTSPLALEREAVIREMARLTGLSETFVADCNLRVETSWYRKELLRESRRSMSIYDARLLAIEPRGAGDGPEYDPILSALGSPFTMMFNEYVRGDLNYKTDLEYVTLSGAAFGGWDWGDNKGEDLMEVADGLRQAMHRNPFMRVMVCSGVYDFCTPYPAARATIGHMELDSSLRKNLSEKLYEAGHMMYVAATERAKLGRDLREFIQPRR